MVVDMHDRGRLGITFAISIFIHLTLLYMFAIYGGLAVKPFQSQVKRLSVEFLDQVPNKPGADEEVESKRAATKTVKVKKETAPKEVLRPAIPPSSQVKVDTLKKRKSATTEKRKPQIARLKKEPEEKRLPVLTELMPTYDQLAKTVPAKAVQSDVGEGKEISLNTKEFKYISYFSKLRDKIQMVWRYPEAARAAGLQGSLKLRFIINSIGSLEDVSLVTSSGIPALDDEAINAVRRAAPFYVIPDNLGEKLNIVANFDYVINYQYLQ